MKSRSVTSLFALKSSLLALLLVLLGAYPVSLLPGESDQPSPSERLEALAAANGENNYTVIKTIVSSEVQAEIGLRGVFDDTLVVNEIYATSYLSIPVGVDGGSIVDEDRFQLWHQIADGENIERSITYKDRFGERTLTLRQAQFLVVPAKGEVAGRAHSGRIGGQHYKAYRTSAPGLNQDVAVNDDISQGDITVGAPQYFLVPVEKLHDGRAYPIEEEATYLAVYNISPRFDLIGSDASMSDQFSDFDLGLRHKNFLAVPATLVDWGVVPQ